MPTTYVPEKDHLLRHLPNRAIEWDYSDPNNPVATGVMFQAFELRPSDNGALSSGWIEYPGHTGTPAEQLAKTKAEFHDALVLKKSHRFARGNVGRIKEACANFGISVRITHEPVEKLECHALVRRFQDDNRQLLDLLASEAWAEIHDLY